MLHKIALYLAVLKELLFTQGDISYAQPYKGKKTKILPAWPCRAPNKWQPTLLSEIYYKSLHICPIARAKKL